MFDSFTDLETALSALGWTGLPMWARIVSVAYAVGILAHGNVGVVRNLFNSSLLTARTAFRVGGSFAAWLRRPSQSTTRLSQIETRLDDLLNAVTSPHGRVDTAVANLDGGLARNSGQGSVPLACSQHPLGCPQHGPTTHGNPIVTAGRDNNSARKGK